MLQAPTTESNERSETRRAAAGPESLQKLYCGYTGPGQTVGGIQDGDGTAGSGPRPGVASLRQRWAALQKTLGNQAVLRMLSRSAPAIQAKLSVNRPGDQYEQEANRVAEQVIGMPDSDFAPRPAPASGKRLELQRQCACGGSTGAGAVCPDCENEKVMRSDAGAAPASEAPPIVHEVLRSSGEPLNPATRAFFEPRFGHDFSAVRIHTDSRAKASAAALNALAFTLRHHIVLGAAPSSDHQGHSGWLLAHELAHVVQQGAARQFPAQNNTRAPYWPQANQCTVATSPPHLARHRIGAVLQRATKKGCIAPSFVVDIATASAFGTVAETLVELDYLKSLGGRPFVDVFLDNPMGPLSYIAFLASHYPSLNKALLAVQISLSGGVLVPDILDTRSDEFYDVKPNSIDGRAAGRGKLAALDAFMTFNSLPYTRGSSYTPSPFIPIPLAGPALVASLTALVGPAVAIPALACGLPLVTIKPERSAAGLLVYEVCVEADLDCYLKVLALDALIAAVIIAAIASGGASLPETVPELIPALVPALAAEALPTTSQTSPAAQAQAKLTANQPGDPYEQEADRVAEQVMRMPDPAATPSAVGQIASSMPSLQRQCACGGSESECEACKEDREEGLLQRKTQDTSAAASEVPPIVHEVLRSPGQPLDPETRAFFEPRFDRDFSQVRVHADAPSAESAAMLKARAYTLGNNIVFGAGERAPGADRRLLAHELTHVIQQQRGQSVAMVQREELADDPYPSTEDGEQPGLFSLSDEGLEFIKRHEGVRLNLYPDSQGHCTIGIGHLVHRGKCNGSEPENFKKGLTEEEVTDLFRTDLENYEAAVSGSVTSRLNQYYFDALVSFTFNVGIGAFKGSGVLKQLNAKNYSKVPDELMKWLKPPEIKGRRSDEANLFRTGNYS